MNSLNIPFFYDNLISETGLYSLSKEESKHAIRSLRLKSGDKVCITNGKGLLYEGIIVDDHFEHCQIEITKIIEPTKRNYYLHVALCITQHAERFEWFVEKATELGIDEITPIISKRTEKKNIKVERLQKISIAAIKQSHQAYLPKINEATAFETFLTHCQEANKAIAACFDQQISLQQWIKESHYKQFLVVIGPEGDFTTDEVEIAINKGFKNIELGKSILRSETAALVVPAYLRFAFMD